MTFLWPELLWALLAAPALVALYISVQRRRRKYALRYSSLILVRDALGRGPGIRRHIPAALFLLGVTIVLAALARPAATVMLPAQRSTVILTMDVSGSMRAEDLSPNRLEAAKEAARAFVAKQPSHVRLGVVAFANGASVVQAPTADREAVLAAIDRLTTQRSTAIGSGILTSLDAIFEEPAAQQPAGRRDAGDLRAATATPTALPRGSFAPAAIVLLSDGQSNTGPHPLEVTRRARDRGVRVYTVGIGSPEGTVLRLDGRSMRVRLDEDTLRRIAEDTDATYVRADTATDLREIYEGLSSRLVLKAESTEITAGFAAAAAGVLIAGALLSLVWFGRLP